MSHGCTREKADLIYIYIYCTMAGTRERVENDKCDICLGLKGVQSLVDKAEMFINDNREAVSHKYGEYQLWCWTELGSSSGNYHLPAGWFLAHYLITPRPWSSNLENGGDSVISSI